MALKSSYIRKTFHFNFDARTSRGRMKDKTSWFIKIWDDKNEDVFGIGECGPLAGLSPDDSPEFESKIQEVVEKLNHVDVNDAIGVVPSRYPSILFGVETALLDLKNGGKRIIFDNEFLQGKRIPINGLVWMGDLDQMLQQASIKIQEGFTTLKIKVGGLNFEKECDILHYIRRKYFREDIVIRLDANGSFKIDEALYKLNELSKFKIHSIEQPIKPGSLEMEELCKKSPIPIAFDEELIGVEGRDSKFELLKRLKPSFIILKPTLHGGFSGCEEWIKIADELGIGWWITSALETNIGLNAICQFASNYQIETPQGLGTGKLYDDNTPSPLNMKNGEIFYDASKGWDVSELL